MGNDFSHRSDLQVEEKAIEVTDFWSHHTASISSGNPNTVSVFIGEPLVRGSLWASQTPLEKASKNFMIHRHPYILKYISSWNKGSKYYVAVEDVKPLSQLLNSQTTLQICIGLYSVLKALVFLHDNANASHNNISTASIYVTKDGNWKLGGLEYLCKFKDITSEYMNRSRKCRYCKAVDPNEEKNVQSKERLDAIDIYAFATLACEVLKKKSDGTLPSLNNFLELCKSDLQNPDITKRPKLHLLLNHPFFNHEFILIYSFLSELPLKSDGEKNDFFSTLITKLRAFDEKTIANQLGSLLLSRMVLLNTTAQNELIPYVLKPKSDDEENSDAIFNSETFKEKIIPKLLDIFCVRDAQIRLLLLEYFNHFKSCFTKEQLQSHILPELLVGIKDTNDNLVAVTLRALADLVPILGAEIVIGGKRAKLFTDGRPMALNKRIPMKHNNSRDIMPSDIIPIESNVSANCPTIEIILEDLPERPSPDGEEGVLTTNNLEVSIGENPENASEEDWEDWDINNEDELPNNQTDNVEERKHSIDMISTSDSDALNNESNLERMSNAKSSIPSMPDVTELDIKNQKDASTHSSDEFNFFEDMEPVIKKSSKFIVEETKSSTNLSLEISNLEVKEEGWDDELDWDN